MAQPGKDEDDDVLRTLMLPFAEDLLPRLEGARVLMLNARASAALPAEARGWRLQQDFRPRVDALAAEGLEATPELPSGEFDFVFLPAPRQRQHGRALLAQAWSRLAKGGVLVACAGNDAGGRSLQGDMPGRARRRRPGPTSRASTGAATSARAAAGWWRPKAIASPR